MAAPRGTPIPDVLGVQWLVARFWAKVNVAGADECWRWRKGLRLNSRRPKGGSYGNYGAFAETSASRVAYVLTNGPIDAALVVRHTCDTPSCCNPAHLVSGTRGENVQDMWDRGRRAKPIAIHDPITGRLLGSRTDEEAVNVSA